MTQKITEKGLTLALTKVGDLLLRNKITSNEDGQPIEDIQLAIPMYQRPYKWTVRNAIQLLDDILEAKFDNKETYRVGTLILHYNSIDDTYDIVDGQQRIITFALLLKALDVNEKIEFLDAKIIDNKSNRVNAINNYLALKRRVDSIRENVNQITEIQEFIGNNCEFIVVVTPNLSEAFQFFDSQNARGKKLFPHDLLKAYHLREMNDLKASETEGIVKVWEDMNQKELSSLFSDYLYRVREWAQGNRSYELNERNIYKFKGITKKDNSPFAQFYKSAYAYADMMNNSAMPFVTGMKEVNPFQLNAPIVAGKPFFKYAKHYFDILKDIRSNKKYEGYFINDNEIVKTLDKYFSTGTGNRITRLLFDVAALLYVDRFCSEHPSKNDLKLFDEFVIKDFIWAYSLRAQYTNLGWQSAQNYILNGGTSDGGLINAFNIYKYICESDSPNALLSILSEKLKPLPLSNIKASQENIDNTELTDQGVVNTNYLHFFKEHKYYQPTI